MVRVKGGGGVGVGKERKKRRRKRAGGIKRRMENNYNEFMYSSDVMIYRLSLPSWLFQNPITASRSPLL